MTKEYKYRPDPGEKRLSDYYSIYLPTLDPKQFSKLPSPFAYSRFKGKILWFSRSTGFGEVQVTELPHVYIATGESSFSRNEDVPIKIGDILSFQTELTRIKLDEVPEDLLKTTAVEFEVILALLTKRYYAYSLEFIAGHTTYIKVFPTRLLSISDLEVLPIINPDSAPKNQEAKAEYYDNIYSD